MCVCVCVCVCVFMTLISHSRHNFVNFKFSFKVTNTK